MYMAEWLILLALVSAVTRNRRAPFNIQFACLLNHTQRPMRDVFFFLWMVYSSRAKRLQSDIQQQGCFIAYDIKATETNHFIFWWHTNGQNLQTGRGSIQVKYRLPVWVVYQTKSVAQHALQSRVPLLSLAETKHWSFLLYCCVSADGAGGKWPLFGACSETCTLSAPLMAL